MGQAELVRPYERKDMAGIENGVEYEHSGALLRSGELSEEDQGWLREILLGKMITNDRASHTTIREAMER